MAVLKKMDHTQYPKDLRKKDNAALTFILKDAQEAIKAYPDNPNAGYYQDEIHYTLAEIRRREK